MKGNKKGHRQPTIDEQHVLEQVTVRLIRPEEEPRFNELLVLDFKKNEERGEGEYQKEVR